MNKFFIVFSLCLGFCLTTVSAQARQFTCQGSRNAIGTLILNCENDVCSVSGSVSSRDVAPSNFDLQGCDAVHRPETGANEYKTLAYYDVQTETCWANYIRVTKELIETGRGAISLVRTSGGDQHDCSGYQYVQADCQ